MRSCAIPANGTPLRSRLPSSIRSKQLPAETLQFLLASRYCETDRLADEAWRLFGNMAPGWARVQAVCDYVHDLMNFGYEYSRPTRSAPTRPISSARACAATLHISRSTFCRCLNVPTRYCTGYITDIGLPPPYEAMDFAAWIEVYLGGRWHVFDPRNNAPRIGRILVAYGRDAADVPLTHSFGPNMLSKFWSGPKRRRRCRLRHWPDFEVDRARSWHCADGLKKSCNLPETCFKPRA